MSLTVWFLSVGGSLSPAAYAQETSKGRRRRTVSSMQFFFSPSSRGTAIYYLSSLILLQQAEEDAASLRAELNMIQQQAMSGSLGALNSIPNPPDQIQTLETELANIKSELQVKIQFAGLL